LGIGTIAALKGPPDIAQGETLGLRPGRKPSPEGAGLDQSAVGQRDCAARLVHLISVVAHRLDGAGIGHRFRDAAGVVAEGACRARLLQQAVIGEGGAARKGDGHRAAADIERARAGNRPGLARAEVCADVLEPVMLKLLAIAGVNAEKAAQSESAPMETRFFMEFLIGLHRVCRESVTVKNLRLSRVS
jgi:hypothetical protein